MSRTANRLIPKIRVSIVIVFLGVAGVAASQNVDFDQIGARDELRWGVGSLHAGKVNESIVSLNRSLSFDSSQTLARYWLGRAYYTAGFEEAALAEWQWIIDRGEGTAVLGNWVERVLRSRGLTEERLGDELTPGRLVTMAEVPGLQGGLSIFNRPAMVRPRPDGYFYVVSFAGHQVVLMDPNGVRAQVIDGGLEGFDRPFDVLLLPDGGMLVSEFGADRISFIDGNGIKTGSFGVTGRRDGQLLGPQYLASDTRGFVYVSDYGNRRITKFTSSGEFVISFGRASGGYQGLLDPAGLVWHNERVYVADTRRGEIVVFDESGNHLGSLGSGELQNPEALTVYRDGILLVADGNRLLALNVNTGRMDLLADLAERYELLGAIVDANRNVIATDLRSNALLFMAPSEELYTGLTVEIDQVISTEHPEVTVAVTVSDRNGNPVLGLSAENFRFTEDRFPSGLPSLQFAGYQSAEIDTVIVADRSASMLADRAALAEASEELVDAATGRRWLVSAGAAPVLEQLPGAGPLSFANAAVGNEADYGESHLDLAIRLAGSQIIRSVNRKSVVFVTDGQPLVQGFEQYGLVETANFLRNNHMSFSVVYSRRAVSVAELEYLVDATGGRSVFLYQPEGLSDLIDRLVRQPSGSYVLSYTSVHDSDFGRRYIPLEIEAYLLRRSGRDESGYYGPLEF